MWTLDSGASYHMTNNKENLIDTRDYKVNIHFANGGMVKTELMGKYVGLINNKKIVLNDVLYVPSFKRSLLSIDHLSEDNYKTVFLKNKNRNKNCAIIYNNKGKRIYTSYSGGSKVYKILTSKRYINTNYNDVVCYNIEDAINDSDMNLWHRRLGHFNIDLIKEKLTKINKSGCKCKICAQTKLKNFPFPPATNHTKQPFELLHMDLAQAPDYSIYKNKYFLTILDDYTRYSWVIFMEFKSDTYNKFIIWYNQMRNIFKENNIKYIKTDNGTEFFNNNFNDFYARTGIVHLHTVPHNPSQNGRVERLHGTLILNASAMLADAKLNHKFWQDAIAAANYIHNRLPHKGNNNKIPYELLYNNKVDYNKFRVFGCKAYFYIPKQIRKKFSNTTLPGIFLGYDETNHTAYKIYDIKNNKVILSRAVAFIEDEPGNSGPPISIPGILNFTRYDDDFEDNETEEDDYDEVYDINNNINNNNNDNNNNNNDNSNNNDNNNSNNINNNNNNNTLNSNFNINNLNNIYGNNLNNNLNYMNNFNNNNFNYPDHNINNIITQDQNKFIRTLNNNNYYSELYNKNFSNIKLDNSIANSSFNLNLKNNRNNNLINNNLKLNSENNFENNKIIYFQRENDINFHNGDKENNNIILYNNNNLNNLNLNNRENNGVINNNLNLKNTNFDLNNLIFNNNTNINRQGISLLEYKNDENINNNQDIQNVETNIQNNNNLNNNLNVNSNLINNLLNGNLNNVNNNLNNININNNNENINVDNNNNIQEHVNNNENNEENNINNEGNVNKNNLIINQSENEINFENNKINSEVNKQTNDNVNKNNDNNENINIEIDNKNINDVNIDNLNSNKQNKNNTNLNNENNKQINKEDTHTENNNTDNNSNNTETTIDNGTINDDKNKNKQNKNSTKKNSDNSKNKTNKGKNKNKDVNKTDKQTEKDIEKPNKDYRGKRKRSNKESQINKYPIKKYRTRSSKNKPDTVALLSIDNNGLFEPRSYKEIFHTKDKDKWLEAVKDELNNMKSMNVFTIVDKVPKNSNVISTRWVLKYKKDSKGNIIKHKARLVARGFTQVYGIDYKNTFSPTLKQDTLKIIVSTAVQNKFNIHQMDIKSAYLNAKLDEDIYMTLPEGMKNQGKKFCKLNKALYGLKQSGRMWNETLNKALIKLNFKRFMSDPCVYIKKDNSNNIKCLLAVYVDDIIIAGTDEEIIKTKTLIKQKFKATDIGEVDYIIGIKFVKHKDGYLIHQRKYLEDILNKFDIHKYKPTSNTIPVENEELRKMKFNSTKYRQAIGSLLYLAISTRPDILFSVSKASRNSQNPNYEDWYNVLKIFRYLKGKPNYGIKFTYSNNFDFKVYVDADLGGDKVTRRSTTGYLMLINSAPTSWYSKLQHCVSVSTAESEYYGIHECARHCLWYKNIFNELNINIKPIIINTDNKAAIYNCENETINPKSKHIDLKYHSIRELIKRNYIKLKYIESENNLADGFTKYLNNTLMSKFRENILSSFNDLKL